MPASEKVEAPAVATAVNQEVPLLMDTLTESPAPRAALNVPEIVCAATLVTKSEALDPVSDEKLTAVTTAVGAGATRRSETSCRLRPVSVRARISPARLEIVAPV